MSQAGAGEGRAFSDPGSVPTNVRYPNRGARQL